MDSVINSITSYLSQIESLLNEKEQTIEKLKQENADLKRNSSTEDLDQLMQILRRANKMGAIDKGMKTG
ncbi:hypothetical protein MH117_02960 [Paenibacillus sp. ACRRX]|nr:hypothetical protein [Paenibacillus sp. ACRRX]